MSDNLQTLRDDLAYVREVALASEPGQRRKAGWILTASGLIFAGASLASWLMATGLLPAAAQAYVWWTAMGVFALVLVTMLRGAPLAAGVRDRAAGVVWSGVGGAIFSVICGFYAISWAAKTSVIFAGVPTVVLALYGAAWTVVAAVRPEPWTRVAALASFAAAIAIGTLVTSSLIYLAYAAALVGLVTVPGLLLLRERA